MSETPKLINLLLEFGQKLQNHINKKYRPFIKKMLSLSQLTKNIQPDKVHLTTEIIAFKLGIQSKSNKCIEMTLSFLNRLFNLGFIDLNAPNYCENYVITDSNIEKKDITKYQKEMKHEIVKWLGPLIHFKDKEINSHLLSNYEHLIGQPILHDLLELSQYVSSQKCFSVICSYFTYRFYVYEEIYCYTKFQISQFKYVPSHSKLHEQIDAALQRQKKFSGLIGIYVSEMANRASLQGGKYGLCVMCENPAQHFCKITKASLCGLDCKKKHLELADQEFQRYNQSKLIQNSIKDGIETICVYLSHKESPFVLHVLANVLDKPSLFLLVKRDITEKLKNCLPQALQKVYQSKNEDTIRILYFLTASLVKWWPSQTLPQIQYFIKDYIYKIFADKKPQFKNLLLVFKSLDKMFQSGRSIVEIFINLDCEINKQNVIGEILFELSKIAQDKFTFSNNYNRQEKIALKNSCMTLYTNFTHSLNQFKKTYPATVNIKKILQEKAKKPDLQKFVQKFNEHWREGLKTLFNLNLVGLESNQQIVNIIMSLAGLSKKMIDSMMFQENCTQYLEIFMSRLMEQPEHLVLKLLSLYKFIPITQNHSVGLLMFVNALQNTSNEQNVLERAKKITSVFLSCRNFETFKNKIKQFFDQQPNYEYLYLRMLTVSQPQTIGKTKQSYTLCLSYSYLQPLSQELALLQIPLEHLLGSGYDVDKIINLIKQLIPICFHSNWVSLLIKHSGIQTGSEKQEKVVTPYNVKIIKGILEIIMIQADFIMDWLTVLSFICNLHSLLSSNQTKKIAQENKSLLSQQMTDQIVENTLVSASLKCQSRFNKFMIGILTIVREQLLNENIMMLQKFFHILDANVEKYIGHFNQIFEELSTLIMDLRPNTPVDTYIYICDMFKQLLLKILRSQNASDEMIVQHFQLLRIILSRNNHNKEVGDFVMHSLSTIILYNYNLKPMSWKEALQLVDEQVTKFPEQAGVIVRKILNEKMRGLESESENLLRICLKLINPEDPKSSIEAIHDVNMILDLRNKIISDEYSKSIQSQNQNSNSIPQQKGINEQIISLTESIDVKNLHSLLIYSIHELMKSLGESFSQSLADTLFCLFNCKIVYNETEYLILSQNEIDDLIEKMFLTLQAMNNEKRDMAERILNQTLFWSVKNKNFGIIHNLEKIILNKYTTLSLAALKCLKTFIQMSSLRDEKDWEVIEHTLFRIINATNVERLFIIEPSQNVEQLIQKIKDNKGFEEINKQLQVNVEMFVHECRVQMMSVELLPNHKKCLETLQKAYHLKICFNDDILLRMALWKKGIGRDFPPDLLLLEETISNRMMAIHIWEEDNEKILQLCYFMLQRFIDASKKLEMFEQSATEIVSNSNTQNYEIYKVAIDYWKKRRQPLIKPIGYIMPKLLKYCKKKSDRKKLMLYLLRIIPIVENKETVLKAVKDLSNKQFEPQQLNA